MPLSQPTPASVGGVQLGVTLGPDDSVRGEPPALAGTTAGALPRESSGPPTETGPAGSSPINTDAPINETRSAAVTFMRIIVIASAYGMVTARFVAQLLSG